MTENITQEVTYHRVIAIMEGLWREKIGLNLRLIVGNQLGSFKSLFKW